ncbi:MAG: class I SAM-dependent methyltransferase [Candidatus Dormibacteraceae bacterium]
MERDRATNSDSNRKTLEAYDAAPQLYLERTPPVVQGFTKDWIDAALALLLPGAVILEMGTGTGRDARYIEEAGFNVVRTEASEGLRSLLQSQGVEVRKLNVLTDELTERFDMVHSNAVLHHFSVDELQLVLRKVHGWLRPGGMFSCRIKEGKGDVWETDKLERPRYFYYWASSAFEQELVDAGFTTLELASGIADSKGTCWITAIARTNSVSA